MPDWWGWMSSVEDIRARHVQKSTWNEGKYVYWCGGCGQRPWPCDTAIVLAALDAALARERRAEVERDFLLVRASEAGAVRFTAERFTGISSNALVRFAFTGLEPGPGEYPHDGSDMAACERTVLMAPKHLAARMGPLMDKYRAALAETSEP